MTIGLHKKAVTILFVLILFWGFALRQHAIDLKKEHEWSFDQAIQFYIIAGKLHVWDGSTLTEYSENNPRSATAADDVTKGYSPQKKLRNKSRFPPGSSTGRKIKLEMRRGEGPGDCLIVNKIDYYDGQYIVWDRRLKRMTYFSKEGKLAGTERFNVLMFPVLVGKAADSFIFKWGAFEGTRSGRLLIEQAVMLKGEERKVLATYSGKLNKGKTGNFDRPILLLSLSGTKLYYANNREYKIYVIDLSEKEPLPSLCISQDHTPLKWKKEYEDIQWDVFRRPRRIPETNYPAYMPPLFALAASGELLAAVTNRKIEKRQAVIDIFRKGEYIGSVEVPLLYQQYDIFPSFFNFPANIYLIDHSLYTLHYFDDLEVFKIIKWKII